jgi:hypothetical protein
VTRLAPSNRRGVNSLAAVAALVLAGCGLAACDTPSSTSTSDVPVANNVVFIGDSLGEQTAPYLQTMVGERTFTPQVFGGTAPCDWLGKDLKITETSVAIISFIGNSSTACMSDGAGGFLHGQALVDKYRSDVTALVAQIRATGAQVLLVGQPQRLGGGEVDVEVGGINATFAGLADPEEVRFVDAGASVEDVNGAFTLRLPCMPGETQCDPDGTIAVRSEDGVHFCSDAPATGCPNYASGAFRFAAAIAAALNPV